MFIAVLPAHDAAASCLPNTYREGAKGGVCTAGLNLLRTLWQLWRGSVCAHTGRWAGREGRNEGMRGWEWLHSFPQFSVTGPSGVDCTLGFCKTHFCHFGWATQVQVSLQITAGWLPLPRGFSKGKADFLPTYLNACGSAEDCYSL